MDKPEHVEALWPAERLPDLLAESDVVILCIPLNRQTEQIIDATAFDTMKNSALLINVARGQVVSESDLVHALRAGQIAGAGLDVTEVEPLPASSPLWSMPNVVITPHVGAQSAQRVNSTTDFACENLRRFQNGEKLLNLVDKQLGFPRRQ